MRKVTEWPKIGGKKMIWIEQWTSWKRSMDGQVEPSIPNQDDPLLSFEKGTPAPTVENSNLYCAVAVESVSRSDVDGLVSTAVLARVV
jgi:hypothetical protein